MTDTNLPLFPKNEPDKKTLVPSDMLNLTTALLGLVSAAIFYVAGWVYEANWYAFYGISLTQINFQPQQVMVEGIPGVFLIGVSFVIVMISNGIGTIASKKPRTIPENKNLLHIDPGNILYTYFIATTTSLSFIIANKQFLNPFPIELSVSLAGVVLVIIAMFALRIMLNARDTFLPAVLAILMLIVLLPIQFFLYSDIKTSDTFELLVNSVSMLIGLFSFADTVMRLLQRKLEKSPRYISFISTLQTRFDSVLHELNTSSQLWTGLLFLFLFFLSIGLSAVLGRIDASYGRRLMLGGWHLNNVYVFSNADLSLIQKDTNSNPEDAPLGLLYSDDQSFFLVDLMEGVRYSTRPNLYIIPRSNDSKYTILLAPGMPTPTLTTAPSPTPNPTITPTQTPMVTTQTP